MTWHNFPFFVFLSSGLWIIGLLMFLVKNQSLRKWLVPLFIIAGTVSLAIFAAGLWINLERPIFRTLGETRLWYAMFLAVIGIIIHFRWKMWYIVIYCIMMAMVFLSVNYANPDVFDKNLMPALQSPWFIPHVIVYIIGYAFLGVSALVGIVGLVKLGRGKAMESLMNLADNIVYIGFAFLTFGLLFGALWAKDAWGSYWTWDPKETWAFLTWLVYLLYIHFRVNKRDSVRGALWILALSFVILLICWFGINYLPSAQNSVHVYSS